jgi:hypothetical protein
MLIASGATPTDADGAPPGQALTTALAQIDEIRNLARMAQDLPGIPPVPGLPHAAALDACAAMLRDAFGGS